MWPKFNNARSPAVSCSSAATIAALIATFRATSATNASVRPPTSAPANRSINSIIASSRIAACLIISANPSLYSRLGKVLNVSTSAKTSRG